MYESFILIRFPVACTQLYTSYAYKAIAQTHVKKRTENASQVATAIAIAIAIAKVASWFSKEDAILAQLLHADCRHVLSKQRLVMENKHTDRRAEVTVRIKL